MKQFIDRATISVKVEDEDRSPPAEIRSLPFSIWNLMDNLQGASRSGYHVAEVVGFLFTMGLASDGKNNRSFCMYVHI
jgi:hypothetical protein